MIKRTGKLNIVAYVHMFPPEHNAGSETYLLAILRGMVARGHEVCVLGSEVSHDYFVDGVRVLAPPRNADPKTIDDWSRTMFRWADVAITHLNCTGSAMRAARDTAKPLVHLVHNDGQLKFHNVRPIRAQLLIFNSEWVREASPMNPSMVVHPVVEPERYRVEPEGDRTTLLSLTYTKGCEIFYELARRFKKINFLGVKGAYGDQDTVPKEDLPNITIWEHTEKITQAYKQTKVILMPSDYESYGRVAVEAACSGIPSIVAPTPGLKEALGDAAIYCKRDNVDEWEKELARLYYEPEYYAERSAAAYALGESLRPDRELDRIENALRTVVTIGLSGEAWTVESMGEEAYLKEAKEGGHFDPKMEPATFRPALGGNMRKGPYIADEKLCVNSQGQACRANDPDRDFILVGKGGEVPYEKAIRLGLIDEDGNRKSFSAPEENKAIGGPEEIKAFTGPEENKSGLVTGASKASAGALAKTHRPKGGARTQERQQKVA